MEFSANGGTNGRGKQRSSDVKNPERYLLNPENPYFVQAVTKRNDVLVIIQVFTLSAFYSICGLES